MRTRGDRTLLYGMQSSGATLVALLLAHEPECVALPDVYCGHLAPPADWFPSDRPAIVKSTISSNWTFADHVERFRPTRTVFVVRHPAHVYVSLLNKPYADMGGSPDDKLRRFEAAFVDQHVFDTVVRYEDLVLRTDRALAALAEVDPSIGPGASVFPRDADDAIAGARSIPALAECYMRTWGRGNGKGGRFDRTRVFKQVPTGIRRHVESLCPQSTASFDQFYDDVFAAWRVTVSGWWWDHMYPRLRARARKARHVARRAVQIGSR